MKENFLSLCKKFLRDFGERACGFDYREGDDICDCFYVSSSNGDIA